MMIGSRVWQRLPSSNLGTVLNRPSFDQHGYTSVVDGFALANDFVRSRQSMSEFARQRGVSFSMVRYWSIRARQLSSASEPKSKGQI